MSVDHGLYARLLKQYVVQGVVDYRGFKNEEAVLDQYLQVLENTDPERLSRNEQFAFYVNAYNAWTPEREVRRKAIRRKGNHDVQL
jgi:hypothetical protein